MKKSLGIAKYRKDQVKQNLEKFRKSKIKKISGKGKNRKVHVKQNIEKFR